jgi:hypothetical protein
MTLEEARAELHKINRILDRIKAMPDLKELESQLWHLHGRVNDAARAAQQAHWSLRGLKNFQAWLTSTQPQPQQREAAE